MVMFIKYIKKLILGILLIYGFNLLSLPLNIIIPLNLFTILYVSIFGINVLIILIRLFGIFETVWR